MVWEKLKEELIIPGLEAKSSDDIKEKPKVVLFTFQQ